MNAHILAATTLLLFFNIALAQDIFAVARSGSAAQVRAVFKDGQDIETRDEYGQTPLMYAAGANTAEVVEALVELGADVNARTPTGWSALMYALRDNPRVEVLFTLADSGAEVLNPHAEAPSWLYLAGQNPAFGTGGESYREFHGFGKEVFVGMAGFDSFVDAELFQFEIATPAERLTQTEALRFELNRVLSDTDYRCNELEAYIWSWGRFAPLSAAAVALGTEFSLIEQGYDLHGLNYDLNDIVSRFAIGPEGGQFLIERGREFGIGVWTFSEDRQALALRVCTIEG